MKLEAEAQRPAELRRRLLVFLFLAAEEPLESLTQPLGLWIVAQSLSQFRLHSTAEDSPDIGHKLRIRCCALDHERNAGILRHGASGETSQSRCDATLGAQRRYHP